MSPKPNTGDVDRAEPNEAELTIRVARMAVIEACCRIDELIAKTGTTRDV